MNDFSNLIIWDKKELPHKSGIYLFENIINKKIYIGQAKDLHKRILTHFTINPDIYFHKALHKYGEDNFNIYILEFCEEESLDIKEIYYIAKYKSNNPEIGYNLTAGGQGHLGVKCSEEQKEKLAEIQRKETWAFNYETGEIYSAKSREEMVIILNTLGYKELSWTKIVDAIRNKGQSSTFTFGNTKEEAVENSKNINPIKKYSFILKPSLTASSITENIFSSGISLLILFLRISIDSGASVIVFKPLSFRSFRLSYVIDSILSDGVEIWKFFSSSFFINISI